MALTKEKLKDLFAAGDFDDYMPGASVAWEDIIGKPSSMPASDVYAWAKAATKPSYTWGEIGSKPTTFTPSAHNQAWSTITGAPTSMPASDVYDWAKAATKPSYTYTEVGAAAAIHFHSYENIGTLNYDGTNMNNNKTTGFSRGYNMTNAAVTGFSSFETITYSPDWITQIQHTIGAIPEMYIRSWYSGTTWGGWYRLLHSGNYTTYAQKKITTGTTYPSSPANGDIHIYG